MENIKIIHSALLDIAINFHKLMIKYNIPYYMIGGTMLGAVRHQGFIPWDDDMDFGIPREYYDKAIIILERELPTQFRVLKAIDGKVLYDSCKIENINTIIDEIGYEGCERGLFIDIFPLDRSNNRWGVLSKNWWIRHILGINHFKYTWPKSFVKIVIAIGVKIFPKNFFYSFAKNLIKNDGDYIINYGGYWGKKEIIHKKIFGIPKLYEFETVQFYGVDDYDAYLKNIYNDYMTLPPENKRHIHIKSFNFRLKENNC